MSLLLLLGCGDPTPSAPNETLQGKWFKPKFPLHGTFEFALDNGKTDQGTYKRVVPDKSSQEGTYKISGSTMILKYTAYFTGYRKDAVESWSFKLTQEKLVIDGQEWFRLKP